MALSRDLLRPTPYSYFHAVDAKDMTGTLAHFADDATLTAPVAVVAAGAWTRSLLPELALPLVPTLEQVTYLELEEDLACPAFIDWTPDAVATPYAVPDPTTPRHLKVALHVSGPAIDPDRSSREPDPVRIDRATTHARERYAAHRVMNQLRYQSAPIRRDAFLRTVEVGQSVALAWLFADDSVPPVMPLPAIPPGLVLIAS